MPHEHGVIRNEDRYRLRSVSSLAIRAQSFHCLESFSAWNGFMTKSLAPALMASNTMLLCPRAGDHYHLGLTVKGSYVLYCINAVHDGHGDVHEHQIRPFSLVCLYCFRPV